jgi:8-hydroxy-5-deazaflavin:NADPH oxidoreductase
MTNVTIFGKGNMGSAIADIIAVGGATITHIDTSNSGVQISDELVVLAVPYSALEQVARDYHTQLAGKIVIDITNPVDFENFAPIVPSAGSAAQELAAALPNARVLKAFNTNFAATLASRSIGSDVTTVLIAGDDEQAKTALTEAITAGGVEVVDAGPLARARELEAVAFLQITLAVNEKIAWTGGLNLVR